jgi:hypothetical protein
MQNSRFVVLMGHLNEYPLSDLIGILCRQRKTGRLLIEFPGTPASFYFEEGEVVDVQLGALSGLQAICVAKAQPASAFNFNPLIRASQKSIDSSLQRVVSELFGCWDESPLEVNVLATAATLRVVEAPELPEVQTVMPALNEATALALPAFVPATRQNRTNRAMVTAGLMMLGISSVIAVTAGFQRKTISTSTNESAIRSLVAGSAESMSSEVGKSGASRNGSQRLKERASVAQQDAHRDDKTAAASKNTANAETPAAPGESVQAVNAENKSAAKDNANVQWVDVVMHVENGRVLQAAIANHKSGVDGYEALALRIARQRRYPTNATGQETVRIRVARPE